MGRGSKGRVWRGAIGKVDRFCQSERHHNEKVSVAHARVSVQDVSEVGYRKGTNEENIMKIIEGEVFE